MSSSHPLHSSWSLYFHDPENSDWSEKGYLKCGVVKTIEEFWQLYSILPKSTISMGMFFLMRDDILPLWEDPRNRYGGYWSFKIPVENVYDVWECVSARLVSEIIMDDTSTLTGITISPKKGDFCILKLWNGSDRIRCSSASAEGKGNGIRTDQIQLHGVPMLDASTSMYSLFMKKKQFL